MTTSQPFRKDSCQFVIYAGKGTGPEARPTGVYPTHYPTLEQALTAFMLLDQRPFFQRLPDKQYYLQILILPAFDLTSLILTTHPETNALFLTCRSNVEQEFSRMGINLNPVLKGSTPHGAVIGHYTNGHFQYTAPFQTLVDNIKARQADHSRARQLPYAVYREPSDFSVVEHHLVGDAAGQHRHRFADLNHALHNMVSQHPGFYCPAAGINNTVLHGPVLKNETTQEVMAGIVVVPSPLPGNPRSGQICLQLTKAGSQYTELSGFANTLQRGPNDMGLLATYQDDRELHWEKGISKQWAAWFESTALKEKTEPRPARVEYHSMQHTALNEPYTQVCQDHFAHQTEALFHLLSFHPSQLDGGLAKGPRQFSLLKDCRVFNADQERVAELVYCSSEKTDHHMPQPGLYLVTAEPLRKMIAHRLGCDVSICEPMATMQPDQALLPTPKYHALLSALQHHCHELSLQQELATITGQMAAQEQGSYRLDLHLRQQNVCYGQPAAQVRSSLFFADYETAYQAASGIDSRYFQPLPDQSPSVVGCATVWRAGEENFKVARYHHALPPTSLHRPPWLPFDPYRAKGPPGDQQHKSSHDKTARHKGQRKGR